MTDEQKAKLPKWAQREIEKLERERDQAIRRLNEYIDDQTPSPFSIDDWVSTGEEAGPSTKTRYIQARRMNVDYGGVCLDIILRDDGYKKSIDLQWSREHRAGLKPVYMVPRSYQQVELFIGDE